MINPEYLKFFAIGNIYELDHTIDIRSIIEYCESAVFVDRGDGIHSLSLTSLDGTLDTAVDSGLRYIDGLNDSSFNRPTIHYSNIAKHSSLLTNFGSVLGRTRIFKSMPRGIWAPHRDGSSVIRIIVPLINCNRKNFRLMVENTVVNLYDGSAYVMNTLQEHAAVTFHNCAYVMVMTVLPTPQTAKIITQHLNIR